MGCFPICFTSSSSSSKRRLKHHNTIKPSLSVSDHQEKREENVGKLINLIRESSKEGFDEEVKCGAKKRVTFDLNVKAYEEQSAEKESSSDLVENNEDEKRSGKEEETPKNIEPFFDDSTLSKVVALNPNNRYQDCRKSTDEYEDIGFEVSDLEEEEDVDDNEPSLVQEESSESLFSLSIDSRKQECEIEKGEKEVNSKISVCSSAKVEVEAIGSCRSPGKRCRFGDSVLNPIENLTQWKEAKQRPIPQNLQQQQQRRDKENVAVKPCLGSVNHGSRQKLFETKHVQPEIRIDTSLSSWLVGSDNISKSNRGEPEIADSPKRSENRQISVDLAVEGLNQCSDSLSSRSQSADAETPMIGTIWSYWVHTGKYLDSDTEMPITGRESRTGQKVPLNSGVCEGRLDKATDTRVCGT